MNYNIMAYGAVADGQTNCREAIQKAIDHCNENGGGRVVVPAGKYLSGTIILKSNVELHLENGASYVHFMRRISVLQEKGQSTARETRCSMMMEQIVISMNARKI